MKNLAVTHEPSARPRPISWLALAISPKLPNGKDRKDDEDDVRVASQTFHDITYYRHDQLFGGKRYLSQNYDLSQ